MSKSGGSLWNLEDLRIDEELIKRAGIGRGNKTGVVHNSSVNMDVDSRPDRALVDSKAKKRKRTEVPDRSSEQSTDERPLAKCGSDKRGGRQIANADKKVIEETRKKLDEWLSLELASAIESEADNPSSPLTQMIQRAAVTYIDKINRIREEGKEIPTPKRPPPKAEAKKKEREPRPTLSQVVAGTEKEKETNKKGQEDTTRGPSEQPRRAQNEGWTEARKAIELKELDIGNVDIRNSVGGNRIIEVVGATNAEKSDKLAVKLREVLENRATVTRPIKRADLRVSGLDD
ncbi:unnamed protein product [Chilo suppressalis]|uniref:Uncharacterized protein n=1 Tax=Chilo suppressalis TaxID=168631 RepID=A0ABN8BBK7_CHISP|nr:unnamed protein product [Chilo suppressalis]